MWYYILAIIVLALDQGTKWLVATRMELFEEIPIIDGFFSLFSHRNRGAAFSILEDQRWFLITVTIVVLIGIIWYLEKLKHEHSSILQLGLGLILGGAVGNFIDRVISGEVVDFFKFDFGFYTFPIFNIADIGICVGVGFVMLDAFLSVKREKKLLEQQEGSEGSVEKG
ncbi:signal peptidase II [Paenibacillus sp. SC116]|uniref:signal peptidase II n=1 Tax=Paenibacillus sp. SC116 TaxID=2968986 RepID=UPI00215A0D55|nr:signal peptidase II [Paenibacillus sp. SC116]MCR8845727.1 signal peptidase II [Paenibacillus sp. SC116]